MNMFNGMKVVQSSIIQEVPKIQLRSDFDACSEKAKREMNNWLRERFGTYLPCYVIGGNTIVMHPKHAAKLRISGVSK